MSHSLHPLRRQRLQRSELAVPASNPAMIEKAADGPADYVFLDLEDAVAPPEKPQARRNAIAALNDIDWAAKGKTVSVRINGLDTPYMYRDVVDVMEQAGDRVHTLLVPKVGVPADLYMVEALVSQIEQAVGLKSRVGLEALIETALGMANVEAIAASGGGPQGRLEALHFGVADYAASMRARTVNIGGLNPHYPGDQWHAALSRMTIACRAYGLRAIDGPFGDFSDPEGYRDGARRAAALGCEGKWAIHPSQVALANEIFSPTEAEVTKAARIIAELRAAEAQGKGAASLDGKMIDAASEKMARNVLVIAEAIAGRQAPAGTAGAPHAREGAAHGHS
ncbi:MAG: CoA ester lyase [Rhodobacteraceae bacterium]|nr:CoA ester lyase [Paracoccaceae bacterium]